MKSSTFCLSSKARIQLRLMPKYEVEAIIQSISKAGSAAVVKKILFAIRQQLKVAFSTGCNA